MAVYHSKYASRGVAPRVRRSQFRRLRRTATTLGVALLITAAALGLWRATFGVPDPPMPGLVSEVQ